MGKLKYFCTFTSLAKMFPMAYLIYLLPTFLLVYIFNVKCNHLTHLCTQITSGDYSQISSITFANATLLNIIVKTEIQYPLTMYEVPVSQVSLRSMDITSVKPRGWMYSLYTLDMPENELIESAYSSMLLKSHFPKSIIMRQVIMVTNATEYYFYDDPSPSETMVTKRHRRPFSIAHEQLLKLGKQGTSVFGYVFGELFSSLQTFNNVCFISPDTAPTANLDAIVIHQLEWNLEISRLEDLKLTAFYYIELTEKPTELRFVHPLKRQANSRSKQAFKSLPHGFIHGPTLYLLDNDLGCVYSLEYQALGQNTLPNINEMYKNFQNFHFKRQNTPFEIFFCNNWKGDFKKQVDPNRCETTVNNIPVQVNPAKVNESTLSAMEFSEASKLESKKSFKYGSILIGSLLGFIAIAYTAYALLSMNTNDNDDEQAATSANSVTSTKKKAKNKKKKRFKTKPKKSPHSSILSPLSN